MNKTGGDGEEEEEEEEDIFFKRLVQAFRTEK